MLFFVANSFIIYTPGGSSMAPSGRAEGAAVPEPMHSPRRKENRDRAHDRERDRDRRHKSR